MSPSRQSNPSREITFYLPGMFSYFGLTGRYPAVSITGDACALHCDHCRGKILSAMPGVQTPALLLERCLALSEKKSIGVLISGGCDEQAKLPWQDFIPTIGEIKRRTGLLVSVHSGLVNRDEALALKQAGVDQALIDVIGDNDTFRRIYHVPFGVDRISRSIEALNHAGIPVIPHIVCGLNYGKISGEYQAAAMLKAHDINQLVVVSLMPLSGTPMKGCRLPGAEAVADVIAEAGIHLPGTGISLGCARQRGNHRLEILAIDAGVSAMAIPSDEAVAHARSLNCTVRFQRTCCSVPPVYATEKW